MNKALPLLAFSVLLLVPAGTQNAFAAFVNVDLTTEIGPIIINSGDTVTWSFDGVAFSGCTPLPPNTFHIDVFGGGGPSDTIVNCFIGTYTTSGTLTGTGFLWDGVTYQPGPTVPVIDLVVQDVSSITCGPKTMLNSDNQCVPDLPNICGTGTTPDFDLIMCFATSMSSMIGGELVDINTVSLLVGAIGTNPIITGLVGITLAGIAGQAIWFVHKRKKPENS